MIELQRRGKYIYVSQRLITCQMFRTPEKTALIKAGVKEMMQFIGR